MKGIVDRFEGCFAVIEIDGETQDVPKEWVAEDVQAGDVVEFRDERWVKLEHETEQRTAHIKKLMDSVWDDG